MPETTILAICRYSYPYDEGVQAGPYTQTSHLSLTSKAGSPTESHTGSGAQSSPTHSHVSSPPSSTCPSSEQIEVPTLAGSSAIDATMTPNDDHHLCQSISKPKERYHKMKTGGRIDETLHTLPPPNTSHAPQSAHRASGNPRRRLQEGARRGYGAVAHKGN